MSADKPKNQEPDYQFFEMVHSDTGQKCCVKIGPLPISPWEFGSKTNAAMKAQGMVFSDRWDIEKAWTGPDKEFT